MRFVPPPMKQAARGLMACCAAVCIASPMLLAGSALELPDSHKSDKLTVTAEKGDLLIAKPEAEEPVRAAAPLKGFAAGKSPARRLIDVAVKEDGLWLNSFETRSMPLEAEACAEISDDFVSRLALPVNAVERLADEELMQQTRVCAVNGSLLVTCYGGSATISLRRPAIGDGCGH